MGQADWGAPGWLATVRAYLPRGNTLDAETFRRRHLLLCWILALHIPPLTAFGIWQGFGVGYVLLEMATPTVCLGIARIVPNRRFAAFFVTAGLVFCSSVLVHFSGGMIEAHFHFFVLIGLIALYMDWVPFLWNVVFTVLSHGMGSAFSATSMFNHPAGVHNPWLWATIHGVAVLAACSGVIVFWKNTEFEQQRASALAVDLTSAELSAVQTEAAQRRSTSELLVNLARRNQSLLNRQLSLIAELEQREREPEALSELFQLDHLATRIRRNAESLLVLSGDDPPRLWGRAMPLSEVVRAAAAEVEDYGRVDVLVNDYIEVAGRAVADLAHLLAELIENATTFSPPGTAVRVRSHLAPSAWSTFMLSIEDTGIGMTEPDLEAANAILSEPREVDLRRTTLGFHVVSRLARRYGLDVRLATTPGGGLTALVTLPHDLASERREPYVPPATSPTVGRGRGAVLTATAFTTGPVAALPSGPTPDPVTQQTWTAAPMPDVVFPVSASAGPDAPPLPPPPPPPYVPPAEAPLSDLPPVDVTHLEADELIAPPLEPRPYVRLPAQLYLSPSDPPPEPSPSDPPSSEVPAVPAVSSPSPPVDPPYVATAPLAASTTTDPAESSADLAAEVPAEDTGPTYTADGLVRRVPGAGLAAALRREAANNGEHDKNGDDAPPDTLDRDTVRSMLSQFQAGQRAGRAVADIPLDLRPPEEEAP